MSAVALKLAKQMIDGISGIKTEGLYIKVIHQDSDLIFVEYQYAGKKAQTTGFNSAEVKSSEGVLVQGELEAELATGNKGAKADCLDSFIIRNVSARPQGGWGRLLYYIAMHYAGNHGITADREKSSGSAVGAWNNLASDSSVVRKQLDDFKSPTTPDTKDDCNLASSGIYGHENSRDSYEWNPMLSYGDERHINPDDIIDGKVSEKDRLAKGDEYRKTKASNLNFVYYHQIPDVVNMLTKAGKLFVDSDPKPMTESISLYKILFHS